MHTLKLTLILFITLTSAAMARVDQFSDFNRSLKNLYLMDVSHLESIADNVRLATPSLLQEWGVLGNEVEAHYNDYLNLVVIKKEYVTNGRVKNFQDFRDQKEAYSFSVFASTAFHEMTHADFDIFIEENDSDFHLFIDYTLKSWVKKNFKSFSSKITMHEILGYTASEIIMMLENDLTNTMTTYGYNFHASKCFSENALKNIAKKLNLEKDFKFENKGENSKYYLKSSPWSVYVKGKEVDLLKTPLPKSYKYTIYEYFRKTYKLPKDTNEFIQKLNNSKHLERVQQCYENIL